MSRLARSIWTLTLVGVMLTSGCSQQNNKLTVSNIKNAMNISGDGTLIDHTLKFSDTMNKVTKLNGEEVKITGYMSLMSPLDGSYVYLMNLPLQNCPFCLPNTMRITNTVACYAKDGTQIEYTENPVVVTGTVEVGDFEDDMGYNYTFKLVDVKIEEADTDKMAENYRIYSAVSDILPIVYDAINWVSINADYMNYDMTYEDVLNDLMPEDRLDAVIDKLRAVSETDYADLIEICEGISEYNKKINDKLQGGEDVGTPDLLGEADVIWNKFNTWIQKYEI